MRSPDRHAVILASASPRRRRLLRWLGIPYESAAFDTPEDLSSPLASDPPALARELALEKAAACREARGDAEVVLAFDTLVVLDGRVLGKPEDAVDARRMLRELSGRAHEVVTGFVIGCPGSDARAWAVRTGVQMRDLSDADITQWMASGEYMGCAGAYNIEGQVAEVALDECFQNVAGIPLCHLFAELRELDQGCLPGSLLSPVGVCDEALSRRCSLGPLVTAT